MKKIISKIALFSTILVTTLVFTANAQKNAHAYGATFYDDDRIAFFTNVFEYYGSFFCGDEVSNKCLWCTVNSALERNEYEYYNEKFSNFSGSGFTHHKKGDYGTNYFYDKASAESDRRAKISNARNKGYTVKYINDVVFDAEAKNCRYNGSR